MIVAIWIYGLIFGLIFLLIGFCCLLDNCLKELRVILIVAMVGWVGLSLGAFIMGTNADGRTCRGEFLDSSTREQLKEYSWWSLEPL